jgi:hypothetical protein
LRPPNRRIQPVVDVSASGIIKTNAVKPAVMYGRSRTSSNIAAKSNW